MTGTSSKRAPAFSFRSFRETFALDRRNSQHHGYDCLWLLGRVQRRASCCLMTSSRELINGHDSTADTLTGMEKREGE